MPVAGTYVIGTSKEERRIKGFMDHVSRICGFGRVERHEGVLVSKATLTEPWAKKLMPGMDPNAKGKLGNLGAGLAHLTLMNKIAASTGCQQRPDAFAIVFENDERPHAHFPSGMQKLVRTVERLPKEKQPAFINLNALRPNGTELANIDFASGKTGSLLLAHKLRTPCHDHRGYPCNVWSSAFMIRCSQSAAIAQHLARFYRPQFLEKAVDPRRSWSGRDPLIDVQIAIAFSDPSFPFTQAILAPPNSISQHIETESIRAVHNR